MSYSAHSFFVEASNFFPHHAAFAGRNWLMLFEVLPYHHVTLYLFPGHVTNGYPLEPALPIRRFYVALPGGMADADNC